MKPFIIFLIVILNFTISTSAQVDLQDLKDVKWGMPNDSLILLFWSKLKFLEKEERYTGKYCNVIIENYQYEGQPFAVLFVVDSVSNKLTNIFLRSTQIASKQKVNSANGKEYFSLFQNKLTKKYGSPAYCDDGKYSQSCNWFCKDFLVSLSYFSMDDIDLHSFIIDFEKNEKGNDFRKTSWGMSRLDVKKVEDQMLLKEKDDILMYTTTILNLNSKLVYIFANDKLTRTKYIIEESHSNKNEYMVDYQRVKEMISKKYGKPYSDETSWKNDLYKSDFQEWGTAISLGHLAFSAKWRTPKSHIFLILTGDNFKIKLVVEYSSKQYGKLEEEINEKNETENF